MNRGSMRLILATLLGALASAKAAQEPVLQVDLGGNTRLELLLVPPGTAQLGSPVGEEGRVEDETSRAITISDAFYLGKTEVTVRQFEQFVRETRYRTEAERGPSGGFGWNGQALVQSPGFHWRKPGYPQTPDHPVSLVTWYDAQEFCTWLTRKTGRQCGLPSEAQWEYACRAGTSGAWYLEDPNTLGWNRTNAAAQAHPVAQKTANAWGFFDMPGNVWEWCADYYAPYDPGAKINPLASIAPKEDKPRRVLRGGSWLKDPRGTRSAARYRNDPRSRNADNGFRVMAQAKLLQASTTPPTPLPKLASAPSPAGNTSDASTSAFFKNASVQSFAHGAQSTHTTETKVASFDISWFLWAFLGVALFVVVQMIKMLSRGGLRSGSRFGQGFQSGTDLDPQIETQPTDDGFWIKTAVAHGRKLAWSCEANNRRLQGIVEHLPGPQGQFIFTGQRPSRILVQVLPMPDNEAPWTGTGPDYDSFGRRLGTYESLADSSSNWTSSKSSERHRPSAY